ncbi:MAG: hypothetical protein H7Y07_14820, partial [Pyrinomonadaceae bacterium]|nr:hypothetical protein [Sphingobacteriaceae bacterium]
FGMPVYKWKEPSLVHQDINYWWRLNATEDKATVKPTPFAFPILVDRLIEKLTTETIEDRVAKMTQGFK